MVSIPLRKAADKQFVIVKLSLISNMIVLQTVSYPRLDESTEESNQNSYSNYEKR